MDGHNALVVDLTTAPRKNNDQEQQTLTTLHTSSKKTSHESSSTSIMNCDYDGAVIDLTTTTTPASATAERIQGNPHKRKRLLPNHMHLLAQERYRQIGNPNANRKRDTSTQENRHGTSSAVVASPSTSGQSSCGLDQYGALRRKRKLQRRAAGAARRHRFTEEENETILNFAHTEIIDQGKKIGSLANWNALADRWKGEKLSVEKLRERYKRMLSTKKEGLLDACVYIIGLISCESGTKDNCQQVYIGETIDFKRRMLQHNLVKKGGAMHTTKLLKNARKMFPNAYWTPLLLIKGFPPSIDRRNRLAKSLEHKLLHAVCSLGMTIRRNDFNYRRTHGMEPFVERSDKFDRRATFNHLRLVFRNWKHLNRDNAKYGSSQNVKLDWRTSNHPLIR